MYTPLRNLKPSREWVSFWNIFIRFRVVRGEKQVRPSGGWEWDRAWRAAQRSPAQILRHSSALDSGRRTRRTAARYHQLSVRIRPRSATGLQFYLRVLLVQVRFGDRSSDSRGSSPRARYVCWSMDRQRAHKSPPPYLTVKKLSHSSAGRRSRIVSGVFSARDKTNAEVLLEKILRMRVKYVQISTPAV